MAYSINGGPPPIKDMKYFWREFKRNTGYNFKPYQLGAWYTKWYMYRRYDRRQLKRER